MTTPRSIYPALPGPVQTFALGVEMMQLIEETQRVMAMRMLGMSGLWNVKHTESTRMVTEKPAAFARSAEAAVRAAMNGQPADEVMSAAIRPLRSKTRANAARLTRRGPGLPR